MTHTFFFSIMSGHVHADKTSQMDRLRLFATCTISWYRVRVLTEPMQCIYIKDYNIFIRDYTVTVDDARVPVDIICSIVNRLPWVTHLKVLSMSSRKIYLGTDMRGGLRSIEWYSIHNMGKMDLCTKRYITQVVHTVLYA